MNITDRIMCMVQTSLQNVDMSMTCYSIVVKITGHRFVKKAL